jgi:hypothetical protein
MEYTIIISEYVMKAYITFPDGENEGVVNVRTPIIPNGIATQSR